MKLVLVATISLVFMIACNSSNPLDKIKYIQISKIYKHTQDYQGKTIWFKGTVEKSTSLLGYNGFIVDDGTQKVLVYNAKKSPSSVDFIKVKGEVNVPIRIGKNALIIIKAEKVN